MYIFSGLGWHHQQEMKELVGSQDYTTMYNKFRSGPRETTFTWHVVKGTTPQGETDVWRRQKIANNADLGCKRWQCHSVTKSCRRRLDSEICYDYHNVMNFKSSISHEYVNEMLNGCTLWRFELEGYNWQNITIFESECSMDSILMRCSMVKVILQMKNRFEKTMLFHNAWEHDLSWMLMRY